MGQAVTITLPSGYNSNYTEVQIHKKCFHAHTKKKSDSNG